VLTNPIAITAVLLCIILVVPIVCRRLRIPGIVGLILTGVVVGPNGLGLMARDAAIDALSQVGILYIMFLSGIEIDIDDYRRERRRGLLFGVLTFALPALAGFGCFYLLGLDVWASLLVAALLGSHTLMTYTSVSRAGIVKNPAVSVAIGATVVAVTCSMVILALVSSLHNGSSGTEMWLRLILGSAAMTLIIFVVMPRVVQWCFFRTNDVVQQWLLVMVMAVAGGLLARLAGLEPILGVFLTALALNRLIPNRTPLMNRITFAGNSLFVPIFLLSVGMLIDLRAFAEGLDTLIVAAVMVVAAVFTKWLAAFIAQRSFRMSPTQRRLLFGLTNSHAAGALATVMIGYNLLTPDGQHLLPDSVLNATIILILVSCTISSFLTDRAAATLHEEAVRQDTRQEGDILTLLPSLRSQHNRKAKDFLPLLEQLNKQLPAEDRMRHVVANFEVTPDGHYAPSLSALLRMYGHTIWLAHLRTPLNAITRVRLLMPDGAEHEPDIHAWEEMFRGVFAQMHVEVLRESLTGWRVLPRIAPGMQDDELLIIVQARPETPTYCPDMQDVPSMLADHFTDRHFVVIFPSQQPSVAEANALLVEAPDEAGYSLLQRIKERLKM